MCNHKAIQIAAASAVAAIILIASIPAQGQCSPEEVAMLTAADAASWDHFGQSVAMSGDTAVIGAPLDDDNGNGSGSAYVFRLVDGAWQQVAKLTATDSEEGDRFGRSVAISGDTVIVGALGDNESGSLSGAAYVFREIGGTWQQVAKLTANDAEAEDLFGFGVAISGDTALIGAVGDDDGGWGSGSVYLFRDFGGAWHEIAKLTPADAAAGVQFGYPISLSGNTAVVGAFLDSGAGYASGAAYVFREVGGTWQQIAKLTAADAAPVAEFGFSVSMDGDTAIIGALLDDEAGPAAGAAYVFREAGGAWQQIAKLTAADAAPGDLFGCSAALNGDRAVIGANYPVVDEIPIVSSAYVFREVAGTWQQISKLGSSETFDLFGSEVALSDNTALIGAFYGNVPGGRSGAAHVFGLHCTPAGDCNTNGIPDEDELEGNDCNSDGVPDECPIAGNDCNFDGVHDDCQLEGNDCDTTGILDACEPHGIAQARSCLEHGAAGEFCLTIQDDVIESRLAGLSQLEIELNDIGCGLDAHAVVECAVHAYTGAATVTQVALDTIRVAFDPALPDEDCCDITLSGGIQGGVQVRTLAGNVDGNETVTTGDIYLIKPHLGQTAGPDNFLLDIDANGYINGADITAIKPRIGNSAAACP